MAKLFSGLRIIHLLVLQISSTSRFPTITYSLKVSLVKMQRPELENMLDHWSLGVDLWSMYFLSSREEKQERFGTFREEEVQEGGRWLHSRRRKGKGRTINGVPGAKLTSSEIKDGKSQLNKHWKSPSHLDYILFLASISSRALYWVQLSPNKKELGDDLDSLMGTADAV